MCSIENSPEMAKVLEVKDEGFKGTVINMPDGLNMRLETTEVSMNLDINQLKLSNLKIEEKIVKKMNRTVSLNCDKYEVV